MFNMEHAVTSAVPRNSKNTLQNIDAHLTNIRHSLKVTRESINAAQVFMNNRKHSHRKLLSDSTDAVYSKTGYAKKSSAKITKLDTVNKNYENKKANHKNKSIYFPGLSTVANSVVKELIREDSTSITSLADANCNAFDIDDQLELEVDEEPDLGINPSPPAETSTTQINPIPPQEISTSEVNPIPPQEISTSEVNPIPPQETSSSEVNPMAPQETDSSEVNQSDLDINYDARQSGKTSTEFIQSEQKTDIPEVDSIIEDLFETPSIFIISSTPFVRSSTDIKVSQTENESSGYERFVAITERPPGKKVSFVETVIETYMMLSKAEDDEETSSNEIVAGGVETNNKGREGMSAEESPLNITSDVKLSDDATRISSSELEQGSNTAKTDSDKQSIRRLTFSQLDEVLPNEDNFETTPQLNSAPIEIKTMEENVEKMSDFSAVLDSEPEQQSKQDISYVSAQNKNDGVASSIALQSQEKSASQILKTIDTLVSKNEAELMWKKFEYTDKQAAVSVPPNSVSSDNDNAPTFDKKTARKTVGVSSGTYDTVMKRMLGTVAYNIVMRDKKDARATGKVPGIDWRRQLQMERKKSQPTILYRKQWKHEKLLKRILGPGSYEMKDFIQLSNEKPRSGRGICDKLGPRFDKSLQSFTPGPGTYGVGGVPQRALEDKARLSFSTKGMLDKGDRKRNLPFIGCDLAPCTYNRKSFTEELLNKPTSTKNLLKTFYEDSHLQVVSGYFADPKPSTMGPGHYNMKSFVDEMCNPKCHSRGHFAKAAQYPEIPTERMTLFSLTHHITIKDSPGPASYTVKELPKVKSVNMPGFMSSAKRDDKLSQRMFTGNCIPVGPGRYNIEKFQHAQAVNGHTNVFKSKTSRLRPH